MKFTHYEIIAGIILVGIGCGLAVFVISLNDPFCGDGICQANEQGICAADCDWCGDGFCQANEKGVCARDCDWCGDGFCQVNENCGNCGKDCGTCKPTAYCGDGVCNVGECDFCRKDCSMLQCQNGACESEHGENCVNAPNDCRCQRNQICNSVKKVCETVTCGNGVCDAGENSNICPNDCPIEYQEISYDPFKGLPVIFVHGHSPMGVEGFEPTKLESFQKNLEREGYANKGFIIPSDYPPELTEGVWSKGKVSVIMTYYLDKYDKAGNIVGSADNQPIEVYAQRLRDVVEVVKHNTGKKKVVLIAHSMGGLVSREYIRQGGLSSVDKLIMIGTPNHGTYGSISDSGGALIKYFCGRAHPGPECEQMEAGSDFLRRLNSGDPTLGQIKYLTVIARNERKDFCPGNSYWDNVICESSVRLEGAEEFIYDDFSTSYSTFGESLHTAIVYPHKAPEVYKKVALFLRE